MFWLFLACVHTSPPPTHGADATIIRRGLDSELITEGSLSQRLSPIDQADLVLVYGGEERGDLAECGCPQRPRGGLARQQSYLSALRNADHPVLFLNGGYWLTDARSLDGRARADVPIMNQWMIAGMEQIEPNALNVGYNDMAGISSGGIFDFELPLVSANIQGTNISPWILEEVDGLRVGITGITTPGMEIIETPGFEVSDPVTSGRRLLAEMAEQVDIVVLLAYGDPRAARRLAYTGHVDVVIDTNLHREHYDPVFVGDALWVRSHFQTMRLGELRIGIEDGEIQWAIERKIDMDHAIPSDTSQELIMTRAQQEIRTTQLEAFGREL